MVEERGGQGLLRGPGNTAHAEARAEPRPDAQRETQERREATLEAQLLFSKWDRHLLTRFRVGNFEETIKGLS